MYASSPTQTTLFGLTDLTIPVPPNLTQQEINILRNPLEAAASSLPANFGWPCVEGDGIPLPTYNWITQVGSYMCSSVMRQ